MRVLAALAGAFERDPARRQALARSATGQKSILQVRDAALFRRGLQLGQLLQRQYRGRPLGLANLTSENVVSEGFASNVYVFRSVAAMATAAAQPEWVVKRRSRSAMVGAGTRPRSSRGGRDAGWENVEGHPLARLFDRPNEVMSRADLMESIFQSWWLTGNSLTYLGQLESDELPPVRSYEYGDPRLNPYGGNVLEFRRQDLGLPDDGLDPDEVELWPIFCVGMRPIPGQDGLTAAYRYESGNSRFDIPAEMFAHVMFRDPRNPFWGFSPFLAAARQIDMDNEALAWNTSLLEKGGASDWVYKLIEGQEFQSDDEYDEAVELILRDHAGAQNAGRPHVMGGTWEIENLGRSPKEMDFNQSRDRMREEILSVGFTPPVVAGYFENATLANAEVSRKLWWLDGLQPLLERVRIVFERKLVPVFSEGDELKLALDYSGIPALREDVTGKLENLRKMTREQGVPYNESIAFLDLALEPMPEPYGSMPFGVLMLAQAAQAGDPAAIAAGGLTLPTPPSMTTTFDMEAGDRYRTPPSAISAAKRVREHAALTGAHRLRFKLCRRATKGSNSELAIEGAVASVDGIAEEYAAAIASDLRSALQDARDSVDRSALAEALRRGERSAARDILGVDRLDGIFQGVASHYLTAAVQAGDAVASELADLGGREFDANRALVATKVRFEDMAARMVASNVEGVDAALDEWVSGELGSDADLAAENLASMVGLNSQQCANAVNLWKSLLTYDDETGRWGGEDSAASKVQRLGAGYVEDRVRAIAEHEAAGGAAAGQIEAWKQLAAEGLVTNVRKTWTISAESPEVCVVCLSLDGVEVDIDANYYSDYSGEQYEGVPAHVHCWCGELVTADVVES